MSITDSWSPTFDDYLSAVQARFVATPGPWFTTDASGLFDAFLAALSDDVRQHYTCRCCRQFVERVGGIVTIDESGAQTSPLWDPAAAPAEIRAGVAAMERIVRRATVDGVLLSADAVWGTPSNPKGPKHGGVGTWTHFHVRPPPATLYRPRGLLSASQAAAEKREDYGSVGRALGEFTRAHVDVAVKLLRGDDLYRSEKVLGAAEWLLALHDARDAVKGRAKANVLWRAVATAPAGFCHPRSSMIGTLLEEIAAGKDIDAISRSFRAKMHPLLYQRPQAAPTAGAIQQAEKLFAELGLAPALDRRIARLHEIEAIWRQPAPKSATPTGGIFGHLTPKGEQPAPALNLPRQTVTWAKFERDVLPTAERIEFSAPFAGAYTAITTAVHADAPPILQWDSPERRNPFGGYIWHGGSRAEQWGLCPGWVNVPAISRRPHQFAGGTSPNQPVGVVVYLEGARETRVAGSALFPETIRGDLHGVRSVIEAHSRGGTMYGLAEGSACGWDGRVFPMLVRVTSDGAVREYHIDREE